MWLHRRIANNDRNAVYVFLRPLHGWSNATQTATLTASDSRESDELGYSLAVFGRLIVAGDPTHRFDPASAGSGAVYVFTRPAGEWKNATRTAALAATDGGANDGFGWGVAPSSTSQIRSPGSGSGS